MYSVNINGLFKYVLVSEYVSSWQLLSRWSVCLCDNLQEHKIKLFRLYRRINHHFNLLKDRTRKFINNTEASKPQPWNAGRVKAPRIDNLMVRMHSSSSEQVLEKDSQLKTHTDQHVPLPALRIYHFFKILQSSQDVSEMQTHTHTHTHQQ